MDTIRVYFREFVCSFNTLSFDFNDNCQLLTLLPCSGYELVWGTRELDLM